MSDVSSHIDLSRLASQRPQGVGYLDPDVAGEGVKVSDGEEVKYNIPASNLVIPDYSKIKKTRAADGRIINFQAYFYRTGYEPWPAWLYHPTEAAKICNNQQEGAELGVYYRETTPDEEMRMGGKKAIWDWRADTLWRPMPYRGTQGPDIKAYGKEVVTARPDPAIAQNQLLSALVEALGKNNASASNAAQAQLVEALVGALNKLGGSVPAAVAEAPEALGESALGAAPDDDERALWLEEADRLGVKIDKRWGLDRIKAEVEKAA